MLVDIRNKLEDLKSKLQVDIQFEIKCSLCEMMVISDDNIT